MVVFVLIAFINMRHLLAAEKKMSNLSCICVTLICCCLTIQASAQTSLWPLSRSEIEAKLFGHLFSGEYSSGTSWSEEFKRDFTSIYKDEENRMLGTMAFRSDLLCFSYPSTASLEGACFEVWKRGVNCYDFYGADDLVSVQNRRSGLAWQARAWIVGRPSTCPGEPIS